VGSTQASYTRDDKLLGFSNISSVRGKEYRECCLIIIARSYEFPMMDFLFSRLLFFESELELFFLFGLLLLLLGC
jgi:hypothetical protein